MHQCAGQRVRQLVGVFGQKQAATTQSLANVDGGTEELRRLGVGRARCEDDWRLAGGEKLFDVG